ncbi:CAP domain-containing protein [Flavobacterium sp. LS1R49]|uniref:CAP domain-containing protein n=1 Tax=Flavobacterium shii TaxID=2987687 RepID=A0A9X2ZG06_9FLAO|nr:CAP domain-containing protein [Flavobacterium shii]MCV9927887.1 CAP domain-containing protein [Flavobacterium shii]
MSSKHLIYIILTALLFISCSNDNDTPVAADTNITDSVLIEINKLRATGCKCGADDMPPVPALVSNSILAKTAIDYAHDMNTRDFFSHISPEGISPIQRAATAGYTGKYVGEVIARNYNTPAEVVIGWKNSQDHCKAMMSSTYIEMGTGKSGNIWVVNLGK